MEEDIQRDRGDERNFSPDEEENGRAVGRFSVSLAVVEDGSKGKKSIMTENWWRRSNSLLLPSSSHSPVPSFPPSPSSGDPLPSSLAVEKVHWMEDDGETSAMDGGVSSEGGLHHSADEQTAREQSGETDSVARAIGLDRPVSPKVLLKDCVTHLLPSLLNLFASIHEYEYEGVDDEEKEINTSRESNESGGEGSGNEKAEKGEEGGIGLSPNYFHYAFDEGGQEDSERIWGPGFRSVLRPTLPPPPPAASASTPSSSSGATPHPPSESSSFVRRRLQVRWHDCNRGDWNLFCVSFPLTPLLCLSSPLTG